MPGTEPAGAAAQRTGSSMGVGRNPNTRVARNHDSANAFHGANDHILDAYQPPIYRFIGNSYDEGNHVRGLGYSQPDQPLQDPSFPWLFPRSPFAWNLSEKIMGVRIKNAVLPSFSDRYIPITTKIKIKGCMEHGQDGRKKECVKGRKNHDD